MQRTGTAKASLCSLLLYAVTVLVSCSKLPLSAGATADQYITANVEQGDIIDAVPARGEVQATHDVEVGAEVGGRVEKILVAPGDKVKAGQMLASIAPAPFEARIAKLTSTVAQASANVAVQQADLRLAKSQYARSIKLNNTIAASKLDELKFKVDREKGLLDAAIASHDMAQAQLREARIDLARTRITAPVSGAIEKVLVSAGQTINALQSTPVLFQMGNQGKDVMVTAEVAEIDIGRIRPDMQIRFTVDAWPGQEFTGLLHRISHSPVRKGNFVSYPVEFMAVDPEGKLFPGMTAHVTFVQSEATDQILVPVQALYFFPKNYKPSLSETDKQRLEKEKKDRHLSEAAAWGAALGTELGRLSREGKRLVFLEKDGKLQRVEVRVVAENEDKAAIICVENAVQPGDTVVLGHVRAR